MLNCREETIGFSMKCVCIMRVKYLQVYFKLLIRLLRKIQVYIFRNLQTLVQQQLLK